MADPAAQVQLAHMKLSVQLESTVRDLEEIFNSISQLVRGCKRRRHIHKMQKLHW